MKLLTDFDGTLTTIDREYAFEEHTLHSAIRALCPDEATFSAMLTEARQAVLNAPEQHGWIFGGRITAYSDEDLFMTIASQMTLLDRWLSEGCGTCQAIKRALVKAETSFMALNEDAHRAMNTEPPSPMNTPDPETVHVLQQMLDRGDEIVVVSNSSTARIIEKLRWVGLDAADHEVSPSSKIRVRGYAGKFAVDEYPQFVTFAGRPIDTARSKYRAVIEEEHPDIITGDVFSLDIALPYMIAREDPRFREMHLCLRKRSYTPDWALRCIAETQSHHGPHMHVIHSFADILSI